MRRPAIALLFAAVAASPVDRAARADEDIEPRCLDTLAGFAAEQNIMIDEARIEFSARWVGAGHQVSRVPGVTVRIPVERCDGVLAVDLSEACRVLKSRGEEGCRAAFPLTFH